MIYLACKLDQNPSNLGLSTETHATSLVVRTCAVRKIYMYVSQLLNAYLSSSKSTAGRSLVYVLDRASQSL